MTMTMMMEMMTMMMLDDDGDRDDRYDTCIYTLPKFSTIDK
jgi:hypothetical protein